MKIIIAGGGSVGRFIAERLHDGGHEVTILDNNPRVVRCGGMMSVPSIGSCQCITSGVSVVSGRSSFATRFSSDATRDATVRRAAASAMGAKVSPPTRTPIPSARPIRPSDLFDFFISRAFFRSYHLSALTSGGTMRQQRSTVASRTSTVAHSRNRRATARAHSPQPAP